jgi:hypothetical protein
MSAGPPIVLQDPEKWLRGRAAPAPTLTDPGEWLANRAGSPANGSNAGAGLGAGTTAAPPLQFWNNPIDAAKGLLSNVYAGTYRGAGPMNPALDQAAYQRPSAQQTAQAAPPDAASPTQASVTGFDWPRLARGGLNAQITHDYLTTALVYPDHPDHQRAMDEIQKNPQIMQRYGISPALVAAARAKAAGLPPPGFRYGPPPSREMTIDAEEPAQPKRPARTVMVTPRPGVYTPPPDTTKWQDFKEFAFTPPEKVQEAVDEMNRFMVGPFQITQKALVEPAASLLTPGGATVALLTGGMGALAESSIPAVAALGEGAKAGLQTYYAADSLYHAGTELPQAWDSVRNGDYWGGAEHLGTAAAQAAMGGLAAHEAYNGFKTVRPKPSVAGTPVAGTTPPVERPWQNDNEAYNGARTLGSKPSASGAPVAGAPPPIERPFQNDVEAARLYDPNKSLAEHVDKAQIRPYRIGPEHGVDTSAQVPVHVTNLQGAHLLWLDQPEDMRKLFGFTQWPENTRFSMDELRDFANNPSIPKPLRQKASTLIDSMRSMRRQPGAAIAIDAPGTSTRDFLDTIQEELDHFTQKKLGGPQGFDGHLDSVEDFVKHPLAQKASGGLARYNYGQMDAGELSAEIGVRLARRGRYTELGLTAQEARDLAAEYVRRMMRGNGAGTALQDGFAKRIFQSLKPQRRIVPNPFIPPARSPTTGSGFGSPGG